MKQKILILIIFISFATLKAEGTENPSNLTHQYPSMPYILNCSYADPIPYLNNTAQKVICWVNSTVNQSMAAQLCQRFQMKLFTIESAEIFLKYQFLTFIRFQHENKSFFFNAKLYRTNLKTFTTPEVPVYNGYKWASKTSTGCVVMTHDGQGSFNPKVVDCNFLTSFHCEFRIPGNFLSFEFSTVLENSNF
ncbi:unnamed protein product [Chironomus riparius]|uniref:C-type lectin domain-containing protein n=1 Tax=Chironomus riparius TaxID=315576 RepID=A0A9N9S5I7_9DIPT|nr:unnamed protein product [Chironomus riparius]